jgi:hypothetical protein
MAVLAFVETREGIMRIAGLAAAFILSGCVTASPAEPSEIAAATPASVELTLWCSRFPDAACRQRAADAARAHCGAVGTKARFVRSTLLQRSFTHGQEGYFLYDCVR